VRGLAGLSVFHLYEALKLIKVFLMLTKKKVVSQLAGTDLIPPDGSFEVTGREDGPEYIGRKYDSSTDTFSAVVPVSSSSS